MTTLYLTPRAWKQIDQAVRKQPTIETGGILMGFETPEGDWVVGYASEPGPRAVQTRNAVLFDDSHLKRLAKRVRLKTAGRLHYIGDWHSHTIRRLAPSRSDRETVYHKSTNKVYTSASPVMLIVGLNKRNDLVARAFILSGKFREVDQIEIYQKPVRRRLF
ncbi:Mov34/MPN/PAD-1 family protein [Brevibacillus sp. SYSU BS000544]|uniref:Mov34/MPN/PAD-1 family protein n=1 Tax=Brevibacillus sp. SYSU BS000544 TaxID=3416443 RepID=UPI003CE515D5